LGHEPTVAEVAEALEVPSLKVQDIIQIARRPLSFGTPIGDEEDSVLGDFIEDDQIAPPMKLPQKICCARICAKS